MKFLVLHGPNLNLLGKRQPEIYGFERFEDFLIEMRNRFAGVQIDYFQSNHEGDLIDFVQKSESQYQGVIFNAGGFSHTSVAIADAVAAVNVPYVGVHISNVYARERERHIDLLAKYCVGTITGLGMKGYELALQYLIDIQK
ncbi:MAG: type II 3-dehydroquinate dehydratase [Bacteroidia bacterium]|nr:type II 3-dehydroquinate dehydratase [Bacteroidia bacterium]